MMATLEQRIAGLSPEQRKLLEKKMSEMKNKNEKSKILLSLQAGETGKRNPIFFTHPPLGVTGYFLNIVRHLDPQQPAYGIQCPALYGVREAFDDHVAMATYYLQVIRTIQPHPPYILLGHSSGAFIIYEMALQLQKEGQTPPVLFLIDSEAPLGEADPLMDVYKAPDLFENEETIFVTTWLVSLAHNQELTFSLEQLKACPSLEDKYTMVADFFKQCGFIPKNAQIDMVKVVLQMIANHSIADTKYFQKHTPDGPSIKYEGRTVLLRCTEETKWPGFEFTTPPDKTEFSGWEKFCTGPIDVLNIPNTNHLTIMLEPSVKTVAEHIETYLDKIAKLDE